MSMYSSWSCVVDIKMKKWQRQQKKTIKITSATPKAFSPLSKSALAAARTLVGPSFTSLRLSFASNTEQLQEYCAHCACTRLLLLYHVIFYTTMSTMYFIMAHHYEYNVFYYEHAYVSLWHRHLFQEPISACLLWMILSTKMEQTSILCAMCNV